MSRVINANFSSDSVASGEPVDVTVKYDTTAAAPIAISAPGLTIDPPQLMADPTRSSIVAQLRLTLDDMGEAGESFLVKFELGGIVRRTSITVTGDPAGHPAGRRRVEEPA